MCNMLTTVNCLSGQLSSPCQAWLLSNATCCTSREVHLARINSTPAGPSNRLERARRGIGAQSPITDQNCNTIADEHYRHTCWKNSADLYIKLGLNAGNLPPRRSEPSSTDSPLSSLAPSPPTPPTQSSPQHSIRTESHPVAASSTTREQYGSVYLQLHGKEVLVRRSARLGARGLAEIPQSLIKPLPWDRPMKATR